MVKFTLDDSERGPGESESSAARAIERGRALAELARRQHGVVARRQLVALGFGAGAIDWRLRSGGLRAVHRGVYAVGAARLTRFGVWHAAVLAHGDESVLSHRGAAALWGLIGSSGPVDVTAPAGRAGRRGIRLHRSPVETDERAVREGIPTTTVPRTLLDLAQVLDEAPVRRAWEEADRLGLLRLRPLELICDRLGRRRGVRTIRALIDEAAWETPTRSPLEDLVVRLCAHNGLPTPVTNVEILGHEVDAYWPAARLVVEADGFEFHRHRAAFERDRARDAEMQAAGYRVVRITHRRLMREEEAVAAQLRRLLAGDEAGGQGPSATGRGRGRRGGPGDEDEPGG